MDIKKKTSTHYLVNKKELKSLRSNKKVKLMDKIIGIEYLLYDTIIKNRYGYSVILKISTTDANLLSEDDIIQFENTLSSFTFGLDFPVKLSRSNKKQNFKEYREFVDKKCVENDIDNKNLLKYKDDLFTEFKRMEKGDSSDTKSNYIFIFSDERYEERAIKQLEDRTNYIIRALNDINFRIAPIRGNEIIEFFFNQFHKNEEFNIEALRKSGAFDCFLGLKDENEISNAEIMEKINFLDEEEAKKIEEEKRLEASLSKKELKKYKKKLDKEKKIKKSKEEVDLIEMGKYTVYDAIKPDVFIEKEDYIKLGSHNFIRMFSIQTLPQTMNITTLNNKCIIENMEIVSTIKKLQESTLSKNLKTQYAKVMSNLNMELKKTGAIDYDKKEAAKNIDAMRQLIETNSDKLFHTQNFIKLWSDDLVDLENKTKYLMQDMEKSNIKIKVLFHDQKSAFLSTLPFNNFEYRNDKRNITAGGAGCLVPTGCTHLRHKEGKYVGRNIETNSPIILDNFLCQKKWYKESELYSNPNMYIVGKPGSGKSTAIKVLLGRGMLLGEWNAVFDMENEYLTTANHLGGHYIHIKSGKKTGINPMELSVVEDESGKKVVPLYEKMAEITNLINSFVANYRNNKGLTGSEITGVQDAVKSVYSKRNITVDPESLYEKDANGNKVKKRLPILSDLRAELEEGDKPHLFEIAELMKLITDGGLMDMFDCETSEDISNFSKNRFVVFCLKELDEFSKFFAMTTTLSWLWGIFSDYKYKGVQKNTWIDEGWRFAKHKASLTLIEDFSRRGRKYWTSLCISTQSINEFLSTEEGQSVIDLCSTKMIFKQDASLAKKIVSFFGLPKQAQKRLPNFSKGECILSTELGNMLVQVDLFDCEQSYATT